jgi:hypothetical protein
MWIEYQKASAGHAQKYPAGDSFFIGAEQLDGVGVVGKRKAYSRRLRMPAMPHYFIAAR